MTNVLLTSAAHIYGSKMMDANWSWKKNYLHLQIKCFFKSRAAQQQMKTVSPSPKNKITLRGG